MGGVAAGGERSGGRSPPPQAAKSPSPPHIPTQQSGDSARPDISGTAARVVLSMPAHQDCCIECSACATMGNNTGARDWRAGDCEGTKGSLPERLAKFSGGRGRAPRARPFRPSAPEIVASYQCYEGASSSVPNGDGARARGAGYWFSSVGGARRRDVNLKIVPPPSFLPHKYQRPPGTSDHTTHPMI